jgi:SAM-dependent methyltransferase
MVSSDFEKKDAWQILGYPLANKLVNATSFNEMQLTFLLNALSGVERHLDLCTGVGNLAARLTAQGSDVFGIDIHSSALEYSGSNVSNSSSPLPHNPWAEIFRSGQVPGGRFYGVQANALRLPFKDGYFDGVSCVSSLDLFSDLLPLAEEVYRVLQSGGVVAVTGVDDSKYNQFKERINLEVTHKLQQGELYLSDEEMECLLRVERVGGISLPFLDNIDRTLDAFQNSGLTLVDSTSFAEGIGYLLVVQKE